jgi:hypothetical protein
MGRPRKPKLTKQQKWELANQEFVNSVSSLSSTDLNSKLSSLSKDAEKLREDVEDLMQPGEFLYEAKQAYDQIRKPLSDGKKLLKQKTKYVYQLLKSKGGQ